MKTKKQIKERLKILKKEPKEYENEAGWWSRTQQAIALEWVLNNEE